MINPVIQLEHVSFHYGPQMILEDVNLAVMPGEFLGIVGPNGSGKSTMLKIIVGLLQPNQGRVCLFGNERAKFKQYTRLGYVAQNATSFNHAFPATAYEIVLSGLTPKLGILRQPGSEAKEQVEQALQQVGAEELAKQPIGDLSGGQQQRILIARALVAKPELLILDEPTVGVDLQALDQFYQLLLTLRQAHGLTILLVSHDLGLVSEHVTTLACLNKKICFHGPPADFWSTEIAAQVYGPAAKHVLPAHQGGLG
ncbi:MAG TPA: metal ABC transporter ATP-binding protein [Oscillospiraceae bacterium]|nr:metal ABC transporter ATP-binding protein [Oscillospiraceae bacterium]